MYDAATRFNESLVQNIDAIDTAITAVMAGNVAVLVFAIDKIRELQPTVEWWAISLLGASMLACAGGYVLGFWIGPRNREGIPPRRLVPDLLSRADDAISDAVAAIVEATEKNLTVRIFKRAAVFAGIIFLLAGGVVVALARLGGSMVQ
ncbi:MAG: hypothetical protein QOD51_2463 [Candidatus Eremiobacteraeota bacterium]|nr:hypothetical protein [Candidatus Eremiobacteraeota bacterium]